MNHLPPETDWKRFRKLREEALDRLCRRTLESVEGLCSDEKGTAHERYRKVWRVLRAADEDIQRAFDDPRRSQMLLQLALMNALRLVEPGELDGFSAATRERLESLSGAMEA